ncbi:hypothetical protein OIU84_018602 [Salix udensis]|uniref:Kelch repeat-containing F-box family protein n=1 Tax=Salix udensis TaxID=889485 RepID=A0AAD6KZ93_9ROSI|nr:hypothetical protein OIU84_018602 [Salix udensis]
MEVTGDNFTSTRSFKSNPWRHLGVDIQSRPSRRSRSRQLRVHVLETRGFRFSAGRWSSPPRQQNQTMAPNLHPEHEFISALRSSHSTLLYMLSPSTFSFSDDPLHLTWHHIKAPHIWRTDPIVAMVGTRVIIAGGTCYFEEDPLAVEMYDLETCTWEVCEPMPSILRESAASTWLSIAVSSNKNRMYVVEKSTGVAYSFDPSIKKWQGPYNLRPHTARTISCCFIGFSRHDRLIFCGIIGDDIESIKLWEVDGESLEVFREIGEMPKQLVEKMKAINSEDDAENMIYFGMPMPSSISMSLMDDFVYIYLSSTVGGAIIMCDISGDDSGACNWTSAKNTTVNDIDRCKLTQCTVTCCSKVGLDDLDKALSESRKFYVKETV